jgi:hypothetical protein
MCLLAAAGLIVLLETGAIAMEGLADPVQLECVLPGSALIAHVDVRLDPGNQESGVELVIGEAAFEFFPVLPAAVERVVALL